MQNNRESGSRGEDLAVVFLQKKGYRILERNFRFERGEIDIVAEDKDTLVFVEVKARRSADYGEPEDAVTPSKCNQIRAVADGYLFKHEIDQKPCRFDVIAIRYRGTEVDFHHIEDAF